MWPEGTPELQMAGKCWVEMTAPPPGLGQSLQLAGVTSESVCPLLVRPPWVTPSTPTGHLFLVVERTAWLPNCLVSFWASTTPTSERVLDTVTSSSDRSSLAFTLWFHGSVFVCWSGVRGLCPGLSLCGLAVDGAHTSGLKGLPTASTSGSLLVKAWLEGSEGA